MEPTSRATTGSVTDSIQPDTLVCGATYPVAGNNRTLIAKAKTRTMATMKAGIAVPRVARNCTARSSHPP